MKISALFLFLGFIISSECLSQPDLFLWYDSPAEHFEESLVLGNGRIGASVFGGAKSDKIYLNEATLWSGEPVNPDMNPDAHLIIPKIQEALSQEDYAAADSLNRKIQGSFSQSYAPLGTLLIENHHKGKVSNYYRELDISTAVSKVSYEVDGVIYDREYFVSHKDQVLVIKLNASESGTLNFDLKFESLLNHSVSHFSSNLLVEGYAPIHAEPSYRGDMENAVVFDKNKGTRFSAIASIVSRNGKVIEKDNAISLEGGTTAVVYIAMATSFNGFEKNPATEGKSAFSAVLDHLTGVGPKPYVDIMNDHIEDHQKYYNRVALNLGEDKSPDLPTDERLKRYAKGKKDKYLETLYFQYGRYLLISSSRTEGVPANLQGIWNPYLRPPWSSNYTININAEENYWLAENTNLSEMHMPLLSFIKNVSKTGAVTAKNFYGSEGWAACHNSDIWAMSNPVGDFGKGHPVWACWNMGGTWLSTHIWEHYLFTQDIDYLKEEGYEIMKGAAVFCLDWMIEDKKGKLITSPSTSPENMYKTNKGYKGATLYGATADLAMIRECLMNVIQAAEVLKKDPDFVKRCNEALQKLKAYQIGRDRSLQEWYHDWEDADPKHRHQTHLFGLHPGHHITPDKTPALAKASRKALEIKGDETTGWSKGWRINLWARLWDGNRAYKMYRELLRYVAPDDIRKKGENGGGTYPNLFDAHPPFQIDGNFGGAAAVAEMLVQSTPSEIRLLPALPDAWKEGSVSGICARGGWEITMEWNKKKLTRLQLTSKAGGTTTIISGDKRKKVSFKEGEVRDVTF